MGLHNEHEDNSFFSDFKYEDKEELIHKKNVKRMLEDRLERKRLKEELDDELDSEFDWDNLKL